VRERRLDRGVDDRFDLILPTLNWNDGQGYELVPGTYRPVGNDGYRFNADIDTRAGRRSPKGCPTRSRSSR